MPEELQIDYKESTLYSTEGKFTFCFKNLPENAIAVCCYIEGSGIKPLCAKIEKGKNKYKFDLNSKLENGSLYDLSLFLIIGDETCEKYEKAVPISIYYGELPLVLKPTGKTNAMGYYQYMLECKDKNLNLDDLGIEIHKLVKYDYFGGSKREDQLKKYRADGVYLNKDGNSIFHLHFDNEEYYEVFGRVAVIL